MKKPKKIKTSRTGWYPELSALFVDATLFVRQGGGNEIRVG